jgi:acyl carrier protein
VYSVTNAAITISDSARAPLRETIRQMIASIKQVDPSVIGDDTLLFGEADLSVELDSLDALDLALELKERFDPDGDQMESLVRGEIDPSALATVSKIADFVESAVPAVVTEPSLVGGEQPISDLIRG